MSVDDLNHLLPLRPSAFVVLAALARGPKPGVEVLETAAKTGSTILGPGTLYRLMRELRDAGWVERVSPPTGVEDERRQYHSLTELGERVLRLEASRLRRTLAHVDGLEPLEDV